MPLTFHPEPGLVLVCDYSTGFRAPEMVKRRPAIVVSPRLKHRSELCAVVPLSTTPPNKIQDYHCEIELNPPLPSPFDAPRMWVKGDMLATVGFHRLELIRAGKDHEGKRKYLKRRLNPDDLRKVYCAVLNGLGMGSLTPYLDV